MRGRFCFPNFNFQLSKVQGIPFFLSSCGKKTVYTIPLNAKKARESIPAVTRPMEVS